MGAGRHPGDRLADLPALTRRLRGLVVAGVAGAIAGCASALSWDPGTYTVQSGDTLYEIAFRYGLDYRDLAAWNGLGDGSFIRPGQTLRLDAPTGKAVSRTSSAPSSVASARPARTSPTGPSAPPARPPDAWRWPTTGRVVSAFGRDPKNPNGVQIRGESGQAIHAAAGGEVVYSGSGLIGYGQLIIVKHSEAYLSAYGHNRDIKVREGQRVTAGQVIASMGEGPGKTPLLHFEIRRNGKPVDPILFLPAR